MYTSGGYSGRPCAYAPNGVLFGDLPALLLLLPPSRSHRLWTYDGSWLAFPLLQEGLRRYAWEQRNRSLLWRNSGIVSWGNCRFLGTPNVALGGPSGWSNPSPMQLDHKGHRCWTPWSGVQPLLIKMGSFLSGSGCELEALLVIDAWQKNPRWPCQSRSLRLWISSLSALLHGLSLLRPTCMPDLPSSHSHPLPSVLIWSMESVYSQRVLELSCGLADSWLGCWLPTWLAVKLAIVALWLCGRLADSGAGWLCGWVAM